jgi:hypothetical protein
VQELVMVKADVDDNECCYLMDALEHNQTLTFLNLDHNLIGQLEVLNAVQPGTAVGSLSSRSSAPWLYQSS